MKTAVIGASGYIGRHMLESYRRRYPDCIGTSCSSSVPGLTLFDVRSPDIEPLRLEETGHKAVLIAVAKPNIAYCQQNREEALEINVTGTLELVRRLGRTSMEVIFLSSDCVFEGSSGAYDDGAATEPTTEYGRQKVLVESNLPALAENSLVIRLSKIYGQEKGDGTLFDEMACALANRREVSAATDQVFSPTFIGDVVLAIQAVQDRGLTGVMNLCSPESASRHEMATALARAMGADATLVRKIRLHDIPSMAGRPLNTTMICSRLQEEAAPSFLPLQSAIDRVATNWREG